MNKFTNWLANMVMGLVLFGILVFIFTSFGAFVMVLLNIFLFGAIVYALYIMGAFVIDTVIYFLPDSICEKLEKWRNNEK